MTAAPQELSHDVLEFVREGTFPSSDAVLTSEITPGAAASILKTLTDAKSELGEEIKKLSQSQASDVDDWISQARQVQGDIAKCKAIAREIVQEHETGRKLGATAKDAEAKAQLLNREIQFSTVLQSELEEIRSLNETLLKLESQVNHGSVIEASEGLSRLRDCLNERRATRVNQLFEERRNLVTRQCNDALHRGLSAKLVVKEQADSMILTIVSDSADSMGMSMQSLLTAVQHVGGLDNAVNLVASKIEKAVITPFLMTKPELCTSARIQGDSIELKMGPDSPGPLAVLENAQVLFEYLHNNLPEVLRHSIANRLIPRIIAHIRTTWLDESLPFEISELGRVQRLQHETQKLAILLESFAFAWPGYRELLNWCHNAPEIWLARRRMLSLQAVRKALKKSTGNLREVEHVEKQTLQMADLEAGMASGLPVPESPKDQKPQHEEDDMSGWDFDEENEEKAQSATNGNEEKLDDQEAEDAWGWDDDETAPKPSTQPSINGGSKLNGSRKDNGHSQEIILVEKFKITDVPDHLLEIIGRDLMDAKTIQESPPDILATISSSEALLSMPAVVLAMFRAIASTFYTERLTSGNMQLYNDSIFISQKLSEADLSAGEKNIALQCKTMEKFANSAYARELEMQRTILGDLLDGAQGFVNCTQLPNSTECENAIAAVVDRMRTVHDTWKGMLSSSTLMQAMGKLLSTVVSKIIQDVEDMDDISEQQSQRLTGLFDRVKSLEDIFIGPALDLPTLAAGPAEDQENLPRTAAYCADWLRFTYLIDILDSSLEDIKYMWTHGMLGYEYSQNEVIDLVKALFDDTQFRRSFISDIKRIPPGSGISG